MCLRGVIGGKRAVAGIGDASDHPPHEGHFDGGDGMVGADSHPLFAPQLDLCGHGAARFRARDDQRRALRRPEEVLEVADLRELARR